MQAWKLRQIDSGVKMAQHDETRQLLPEMIGEKLQRATENRVS